MKINEHMDAYDIKSISTIHETIADIEDSCSYLEEQAILVKRKLFLVSDEFTTINYERIYEATDDFIEVLKDSKEELLELAKSVKDFEEKIRRIWE